MRGFSPTRFTRVTRFKDIAWTAVSGGVSLTLALGRLAVERRGRPIRLVN